MIRILAALVSSLTVALAAIPSHHGDYVPLTKRLDSNGRFDQTFRLPELSFFSEKNSASSLVASPSVVERNGDSIQVSWEGVTSPKVTDWIGIYISESDADQNYIDFSYVESSPTYQQGYGSLNLTIPNIRTIYQFRYFQYSGISAYKKIATSNIIQFKNINEPMHGRIALTGNISEMRVMFTTNSWEVPVVEYGASEGVYTDFRSGNSATYSADMICDSPANKDEPGYFINPGVQHDVLLTGLKPNTRYYYRFGHRSTGYGKVFSFVTAPLPGTAGVKLAAFGDLGVTTPGPKGTVDIISERINEYDLILHFGDISYAMGHGFMWDQYMNFVEPISAYSPYMVSIGNHEYCYLKGGENDPSGAGPDNGYHPIWGNYGADSGGECGVPMFYRYHMPENGNSLFWYSFKYGNIHILQMSTEHDFFPGSPQYEWMEKDLASVNRTETPFIIFTGHRPMYNSERYPDDYQVSKKIQEAFEDLLIKYKVDVALYGHYHSYERTCKVYKDQCVEEGGLVHITVGSAGAWLDVANYYDVDWSEFSIQEFGFCEIRTTETQMTLDFILNSERKVIDSVIFDRQF